MSHLGPLKNLMCSRCLWTGFVYMGSWLSAANVSLFSILLCNMCLYLNFNVPIAMFGLWLGKLWSDRSVCTDYIPHSLCFLCAASGNSAGLHSRSQAGARPGNAGGAFYSQCEYSTCNCIIMPLFRGFCLSLLPWESVLTVSIQSKKMLRQLTLFTILYHKFIP